MSHRCFEASLWNFVTANQIRREAPGLTLCRCYHQVTQHPNPPNLKQAHKGEGLPSPYPLPDGRGRSVATFPNGVAAPLESKIRGQNVYLLLMGPTRPAHIHIICQKSLPTPPYFIKKLTICIKKSNCFQKKNKEFHGFRIECTMKSLSDAL